MQGEPAEEVAAEQAREAEVVGGAADLRQGERRCRYGSHFLGLAVRTRTQTHTEVGNGAPSRAAAR